MEIPQVGVRRLLEAGVHFGHTPRRWNPKMAPYIFGERNGVHIIDLDRTVPELHRALVFLGETARAGGRVLFVGTKGQASRPIREAAESSAQYFINYRWLGGTLTNWRTVSNSISRLKALEEQLKPDHAEHAELTKKDLIRMERRRLKLDRALGGIKDMGGLPDALFVIDTNREQIAVTEARRLSIPIVAVVDTNSNPDGIDYPIPGNDDASRAIRLYLELAAAAVIQGMGEGMPARAEEPAEVDPGEAEEPAPDPAVAAAPPAAEPSPPAAEPSSEGDAESSAPAPESNAAPQAPNAAPQGPPQAPSAPAQPAAPQASEG